MSKYNEFIAKKLEELIAKRDLNKKELAERMGIRPDKLSRLCHAVTKIEQEEITKIISIYGLPENYFNVPIEEDMRTDKISETQRANLMEMLDYLILKDNEVCYKVVEFLYIKEKNKELMQDEETQKLVKFLDKKHSKPTKIIPKLKI